MATMMTSMRQKYHSSLFEIHSNQIAKPFLDLLALFSFIDILVTNSIFFFLLMATMMTSIFPKCHSSYFEIHSNQIAKPFLDLLALFAFIEILATNSISFFY